MLINVVMPMPQSSRQKAESEEQENKSRQAASRKQQKQQENPQKPGKNTLPKDMTLFCAGALCHLTFNSIRVTASCVSFATDTGGRACLSNAGPKFRESASNPPSLGSFSPVVRNVRQA